jgi:hypothetical protein
MTTKVSVVNEHSTSFMGGIWDISPTLFYGIVAMWDDRTEFGK